MAFAPTAAPDITHSSQIKDLPWKGSFASDSICFAVIDKYILLPTTSVAERMAALYAMGRYGMGIDEQATIRDLADYLRISYDAERLPFMVVMQYLDQIRKYVPLTYPVMMGQTVRMVSTGEGGVVTGGGLTPDDPLIVNMGANATFFPKVKFDNHADVEQLVFIDPDGKETP